ncbi:hypothetical protein EON67_00225 [archaeon]|nr:MAG: hypothetical protein EON67_00225 [archaeon]
MSMDSYRRAHGDDRWEAEAWLAWLRQLVPPSWWSAGASLAVIAWYAVQALLLLLACAGMSSLAYVVAYKCLIPPPLFSFPLHFVTSSLDASELLGAPVHGAGGTHTTSLQQWANPVAYVDFANRNVHGAWIPGVYTTSRLASTPTLLRAGQRYEVLLELRVADTPALRAHPDVTVHVDMLTPVPLPDVDAATPEPRRMAEAVMQQPALNTGRLTALGRCTRTQRVHLPSALSLVARPWKWFSAVQDVRVSERCVPRSAPCAVFASLLVIVTTTRRFGARAPTSHFFLTTVASRVFWSQWSTRLVDSASYSMQRHTL